MKGNGARGLAVVMFGPEFAFGHGASVWTAIAAKMRSAIGRTLDKVTQGADQAIELIGTANSTSQVLTLIALVRQHAPAALPRFVS